MTSVDPIVKDHTERWFIRQGLPHLIDDYSVREDVFTRMFPFLGLVVFLELFLVFGDRWSGWAQAAAFVAGLAAVVASFVLVNWFRGRPLQALPDEVGLPELVLFFALPAIPTAIGAEDDLAEKVGLLLAANLVVLAVGFVLTSWGVIPMMRWSVGQMVAQLSDVANLALKSLPILLIFSAFIFLNAEMWQVAHDFTLPYFLCVGIVVVGIGTGFVMLSIKRMTLDLARFERWEQVEPLCAGTPVANLASRLDGARTPQPPDLGRRAEWNVALLFFVAQAIQILLVAVVIMAFYLLFGLLTVRAGTLLQWTTAEELTRGADWLVRIPIFGDELIFTRQLVLVSAFIGLMSGLQFAVQVVTDETYRSEFAAGMTAELREALAVRAVYHEVLVDRTP